MVSQSIRLQYAFPLPLLVSCTFWAGSNANMTHPAASAISRLVCPLSQVSRSTLVARDRFPDLDLELIAIAAKSLPYTSPWWRFTCSATDGCAFVRFLEAASAGRWRVIASPAMRSARQVKRYQTLRSIKTPKGPR